MARSVEVLAGRRLRSIDPSCRAQPSTWEAQRMPRRSFPGLARDMPIRDSATPRLRGCTRAQRLAAERVARVKAILLESLAETPPSKTLAAASPAATSTSAAPPPARPASKSAIPASDTSARPSTKCSAAAPAVTPCAHLPSTRHHPNSPQTPESLRFRNPPRHWASSELW